MHACPCVFLVRLRPTDRPAGERRRQALPRVLLHSAGKRLWPGSSARGALLSPGEGVQSATAGPRRLPEGRDALRLRLRPQRGQCGQPCGGGTSVPRVPAEPARRRLPPRVSSTPLGAPGARRLSLCRRAAGNRQRAQAAGAPPTQRAQPSGPSPAGPTQRAQASGPNPAGPTQRAQPSGPSPAGPTQRAKPWPGNPSTLR